MSSQILHPPAADFARRKKRWGIVAIAAVGIIIIPLLLGLSGITSTFFHVFTTSTAQDSMQQEILAEDVSRSLRLTMFGLIGSMAGVILLMLAIVRRAQLDKQSKSCT